MIPECLVATAGVCSQCKKNFFLLSGGSACNPVTAPLSQAECSFPATNEAGTYCPDGGCSWSLTYLSTTGTAVCDVQGTACHTDCETCHTSNQADQCVTCYAGFHLTNTGECEAYTGDCHYTCDTTAGLGYLATSTYATNPDCAGGAIDECIHCRPGWYHGDDTTAMACEPCVRHCLTCNAAYTSAACITWTPGFYDEFDTGKPQPILIIY